MNKTTSIRGRSLVLRIRNALLRVAAGLEPDTLPARIGASVPSTGDWLGRWMDSACPKHSAYSYAVLHRRWTEELGSVPLPQVTVHHIRPVLRGLVDAGRAGGTVWAYRTFIRTVLQDAVREGLIDSNPCDKLRRAEFPSRRPRKPRPYYSLGDIQRFLGHTDGLLRAVIAFCSMAAARLGEARGAQVQDYVRDLLPLPMVRIAHSWRDREHGGALGETKTDVVREMPAHPVLSAVLDDWIDRGWHERFGRKPKPNDWMFPSDFAQSRSKRLARPLCANTIRSALYTAADELGLPRRVPHSMCKTFVTAMRAAGAPRDLVKYLRHPRPNEVHDAYLAWEWPTLCEAVARLPISLAEAEPTQLGLFDEDPPT